MACCRCCNFNKPNLKDLYEESYDDDGSSSTLATKLEAVSGIQINQDDLCLGICFQCKLILEISFEFQKMVKKNEHLYSQQQQISNETIIQDAEMFEEEEFLEDQLTKYIPEEQGPSTPSPKKDKKEVFCENCGKIFHTKVALDIHKKLRHKNAVSHEKRTLPLSPKKNVKNEVPHTDNDTKDESKLICTVCEREFHTEKALALHVKLKHKKH